MDMDHLIYNGREGDEDLYIQPANARGFYDGKTGGNGRKKSNRAEGSSLLVPLESGKARLLEPLKRIIIDAHESE